LHLLIVDDHPLFREGLKFLLGSLDSELEIDEAGDCRSALGFSGKKTYDLVLLDLKMPGVNGMAALEAMRREFPFAPLVVVSGDHAPALVRETIDRGAMGFIPKSSTPDQLVHALRQILAHKVFLPTEVVAPTAEPPTGMAELTPRQLDVLRSVIQGKPNKEVARELGVSADTVKTHLAAVMRALDARNRTELVYIAAQRGLSLG
jgi:DNA-binding NarL/FixJ family response regulator